MKILADENIPNVEEAFADLGQLTTIAGRDISPKDLINTDILLIRSVTRINRELLESSKVQFIASATAGVNHVDREYLKEAGISFACAPGSNAVSAAEYVVSAICFWSLCKQRPLEGLRIGVIGCGNVGSRVVQLAQSLGMRCVRHDPPLQDLGYDGFRDLTEALSCNIVTLHVPLELQGPHPTLNLMNGKRLSLLEKGTLLINASRGEVINEQALLSRMQTQSDLDVVLDVWSNEPEINKTLLQSTLLGTPHIAGYSLDAKLRGTQMIYEACCDYLGVKPTWQAIKTVQIPKADQSEALDNDIRKAVLSAYDISQDSNRLKKILTEEIQSAAAYFDLLRKNYPVRHEYSGQLFADISLN